MDQSKPKVAIKYEENDYTKILIALFVIVLTFVFVYLYKLKRQSRRGILITGLCDTGKTLLYGRLMHGKFVNTQTSIKENVGDYSVRGGTLKVIDIPGHERLRDKFFENYKSVSRGIIYVIDSNTIEKDIRDVAEFLYNILSDSVISSNKPQVLLLCNKQDQVFAKNANAVKTLLEKELNTLRITKSSQLESVDPKTKKSSILGDESQSFTFASIPQYKIEFIEAHGTDKNTECNIQAVQKWLDKVA